MLRVTAGGCWVEGCRSGKEHCREGREATIVQTEGVVLFPDPVLIPACRPCCSLLAHNPDLLCLSHARDCPLLSPNRLVPIHPLLHLDEVDKIKVAGLIDVPRRRDVF